MRREQVKQVRKWWREEKGATSAGEGAERGQLAHQDDLNMHGVIIASSSLPSGSEEGTAHKKRAFFNEMKINL